MAGSPTEFPVAETFYPPEGAGLLLGLSPMMIAALLAMVLAAGWLGWRLGVRGGGWSRPADDPTEHIYGAIRKAILAAAGAPRDAVISSGRHLKATLDDRLGAVLRLSGGFNGACKTLDEALEGLAPPEPSHSDGHGDKPKDEPRGGIEKLVINARRVVVNAVHPHAAEQADAPSHHDPADHAADDPGHGHGGHEGQHGAGHGKPLDAPTQIAHVRAAIHALSDHWSDRPARLAELRAARRQLTAVHPGSALSKSGAGH